MVGSLYKGNWEIMPHVSLDYILNFKGEETESMLNILRIEDVWVDLGQAIKILASYGQNVTKINKVWNINSNAHCPILDFIHQTVQKPSRKSDLFKRCLESLVKLALCPTAEPGLRDTAAFLPDEYETSDSSVFNLPVRVREQEEEEEILPSKRKRKKRKIPDNYLDIQDYSEVAEELGAEPDLTDDIIKTEADESSQVDDVGETDWAEQQLAQVKEESQLARVKEEPEVRCQLCADSFLGEMSLYNHYITAHPDQVSSHPTKPKRSQECTECFLVFTKKAQLTEHYRSLHPDVPVPVKATRVPCAGCSKKFVSQHALYKHCVNHHPQDEKIWPENPKQGAAGRHQRLFELHERTELRCGLPTCGHAFQHFKGLARHERGHTEAFICILCGNPCYSADLLISHCETEHPGKSEHICRVCGFFNHTELKLKLHTLQIHMKGSKEHLCPNCDYKTSNYSTFQAHLRSHNSVKNYVCDECGKVFHTPQAHSTHKKTHQPAESFQYACTYCPKRFPHVSLLNIHQRTHTGEKPFQCKDCGQCFGSQSSLIKHNRNRHTPEEEMPYKCEECGKTFSKARRKVYLGHLKQHSGVRDHACPVCKAAFSSRGYLGNHFKKVHKRKLHEVEEEIKIKSDPLQSIHPQEISYTLNIPV